MVEILKEIPFLTQNRLQFLVWDKNISNLGSWAWKPGVYIFFQSRRSPHGPEFRFGSPIWGAPNNLGRLVFPFFSPNNLEQLKHLSRELVKSVNSEDIYILVSEEDLTSAKSLFAKLQLLADPNVSEAGLRKRFGIVDGSSTLAIGNGNENNSVSLLSKYSVYPPLVYIPKGSDSMGSSQKLEPEPKKISSKEKGKEPAKQIEVELLDEKPLKSEVATEKSSIAPAQTLEPTKESTLSPLSGPTSSEKPQAKFSLQVKMMGVISLLLLLSLSVIIIIASVYFKQTIKFQLLSSNIRMAEIVGAKVESDIVGVSEKGKQIAITLTSQGLDDKERSKLVKTMFQSDKEFIYLGIFETNGERLVMKREVFNEEELKKSAATEDDFHNLVTRNQDLIAEAFAGKPVLFNSSPGFTEPSFTVVIPTEENGKLDNVLVMVVKLSKIIEAFSKKGIETTFFVNGSGTVIAHPKEDLVLAATDLSNMSIVKSMLTGATNTGQTEYLDEVLQERFLGFYRKIGFADSGVVTIISEKKAYEDVVRSQIINILIAGIGLCVTLIFIFFFSKTITKPVLQLLNATLEIARGNFRIGIKPTTQDEVGLLTHHFIEMGQGLEEREKVKNILGSMIDPVVVKEAMVDLAALKRGSETTITAFFSDVAGFSTISEQLKSADLAALLNEYLSAMTLILKKHEGVLDKYIGDAIVGIFNAPVAIESHELKAARASAEMVLKLDDLRAYWKKNDLYSKEAQEMDARIGLNSGSAKVGFMGTDALASYTMMGDTVNLAARLEAAGKDYGVNVLITDSVCDKIQDEMVTRYMDLVRVKGKNEPVRIHELVGFKSMVKPEIVEAAKIYETAFAEYRKQNWDKAIKLFKEVEKAKQTKDKASKILIERCEEYKTSSPGKNWDGVFTRTHK